MLRGITAGVLGLALMVGFVPATPAQASGNTIVDIAVGSAPEFTALVDAVVARDLAGTLSGPGPFTVFAPTNEAFENLPQFVKDAIAEKPELLTDILLYHVVADDLDSSEVLASQRIKTLQGQNIFPNTQHGAAFVNNSELVALDIDASNGTIHVIDEVLLPSQVLREAFQIERDGIIDQIRALQAELADLRHVFFALINDFRTFR